jgi:hypothetical protein
MALLPEYPKELLNANWQKKKGTVAKIATAGDGTGIGKKLDALKAAFDKVGFGDMETRHIFTKVKKADFRQNHIDEWVETCKSVMAKSLDARKIANEVNKDAKDQAASWAKNKLIPKSSVQAAAEVADKALTLAYAMNPNSLQDWMSGEKKALEDELQKQQANAVQAAARVKHLANNIKSKAPAVKTPEEWTSFWMENVRGLGTVIPFVAQNNPALKKRQDDFKKVASNQNTPKEAELDHRKKEVLNMADYILANIG